MRLEGLDVEGVDADVGAPEERDGDGEGVCAVGILGYYALECAQGAADYSHVIVNFQCTRVEAYRRIGLSEHEHQFLHLYFRHSGETPEGTASVSCTISHKPIDIRQIDYFAPTALGAMYKYDG